MGKIKTNSQHYADIASAIRYKNEGADVYYPSDMAQAILDIPTGGGGSLLIKNVFNHGTVSGLNPIYGFYDSSQGCYTGILNSMANGGSSSAYFSIENNDYIRKYNHTTSGYIYSYMYSIFSVPFSSANYRKLKVDCEVINGDISQYNQSGVGVVEIVNLYGGRSDPSVGQSYIQSAETIMSDADAHNMVQLTSGGSNIYNKDRGVVAVDITDSDTWLCICLKVQACELKVYGIWLEE